MNSFDWILRRKNLTQEEIDWLFKSFREDMPQNFDKVIKSLRKGQFVKTKENVILVRNMLKKFNLDFDEDLNPDQ